MAQRATFSLDDDIIEFLNREGGDNKSAYVNDLLKREKQRILQEALLSAFKKELTGCTTGILPVNRRDACCTVQPTVKTSLNALKSQSGRN